MKSILNNKFIYFINNRKNISKIINEINLTPITEPEIMTVNNFYDAPWISTYYYETTINKNEEIIIPCYVTNYEMSEYRFNDMSKQFLIEANINGNKILKKVTAGDFNLNLGSINVEGEFDFDIQATDLSNNIKSIINTGHLYIVDKNKYPITESQTYTMTNDDLVNYNIKIYEGEYIDNTFTDTDMENNILGLNQLINDVKEQGYRKLKLYKISDNQITSYRCQPHNSRDNAIIVPSNFTLDLNGTKIKQHLSYGSGSLLISMVDGCIDTHIINGYIEGDYDKHIVNKQDPDYPVPEDEQPLYEGEGYNVLQVSGAFSSIENLDIGYGTGYTITNGKNEMILLSSLQTWTPVYIDCKGNEHESSQIMTSDFRDLSNIINNGYRSLSCNTYGGYGGISGDSDICYVYFYDENYQYITTKKTRQYKLINIPLNAKYARVSLLTNTTSNIGNGSGAGFCIEGKNYKQLTNFKCVNIYSHDCRTVAYATGIFNGLLLENCTVINCGQMLGASTGQVTALAIDVEDGYQYSENYYFHNTKLQAGDNGSNTMVHVCGHNLHIWGEECEGSYDLRYGVKGLCLHNTTSSLKLTPTNLAKTGFTRIYDNTFTYVSIKCNDKNYKTVVKNCVIRGGNDNDSGVEFRNCDTMMRNAYYNNSGATYIDSMITIPDATYLLNTAVFENCVIQGDGYIRPHTNITTYNNCDIYIPIQQPVSEGTAVLNNCKLYNSFYDNALYDYLTLNNCEVII